MLSDKTIELMKELGLDEETVFDAVDRLRTRINALKRDHRHLHESIVQRTNKFVYYNDGSKTHRKEHGKKANDLRTLINAIGNAITDLNREISQIEEMQIRKLQKELHEGQEQDDMDYDDTYDPGFDEPHDEEEPIDEDEEYDRRMHDYEVYMNSTVPLPDYDKLKDELDDIKKKLEPPKLPELDYVINPSSVNRRFICGYGKDEVFVMVFWNYFKDVSNGHGDLEEFYRKNYDAYFNATAGGFYMSNGHNNCADHNLFYLFGRSDTFGNFKEHIDEIRAYGKERCLKFVLGRTDLGYDKSSPLEVMSDANEELLF